MTALEPSLVTVAVTVLLAYGLWRVARSPIRRWLSRRVQYPKRRPLS